MTITRRWQSGFESGHIREITSNENSAWVSTAQKKTGNYSVGVDGQQIADGWILQTFPATKQVRAGFFWWAGAATIATYVDVFAFRRSGGTYGAKIRKNGGTGGYTLQLYVNGALRDTLPGGYTHSSWMHIGIDAYIDPVAGWVKVYADGVEILSYTGNTGSIDLVDFLVGQTPASAYTWDYFDDMYVDDTTGEGSAVVVPILRFYPITADGNGNYAQWVGSDDDSTDNYLLIDERPPSTADYVEAKATDKFDSYTMTSVTLGTEQSLWAVIPLVYAQREGTTEQLALGTRLSSTDLIGSDQNISVGAHGFLWERQVTKPGGGAWGQSDLDGVEVVLKSRGTYS